ncbi:RagB/SusD family nutrient uptake outer membrane protein [Seonamhaeicola marinus]|uniref:RagB/SusD family nutrient uptake outer membrane protein n=1 Tax=Seonamhaeicola marinus TaxID=1912246 RepID=A0A5D0IKJ6_9FLAO|nr:RagB/SusD family nutrient uptake outer membrane protein [Seonamhaeicola marinus]TYA84305.1 RagB/SusD family nutrient uptake outer membrane protein [Seonamhaeicola marinus]
MQKEHITESTNGNPIGVFIKQNMMKNVLVALVLMLSFSSCEDYFEPKLTNERTEDQLLANANFVEGLLTFGYRSMPSSYEGFDGDFLDVATDNAISNQIASDLTRMLAIDGFYTSFNNPLNIWSARYDELKNVNKFIEVGLDGTVVYLKSDETLDETFRNRLRGEAYFLRAWMHFDLLRRYGGVDTSGQLMGIPLVTTSLDITGELNLTRNTYAECVQQIVDDIDEALAAGLLDEYTGDDEVLGDNNIGRPTTVACRALKSRVLLYAASPSFGTSTYAQAAQAAKDVIDQMGATLPDIYNVNNISNTFFNNDVNDELILRRVSGANNGDNAVETRNFPPSHLGSGRCNPTQNLVDAFPMANGYPIGDAMSGYDEDNMYVDRDPRFYMTVIHNGQTFKGQTIETFVGGNNTPGAPGVTVENATRTGYYLRKWVSSSANLVPGNIVRDQHYNAVFRKVEMFLNFAEAANEANGPDDVTYGMSAREAIAEVRRRAGIASGGSDDYLASITSREEMRDLIKNERRIELCFEGHRFFDLRRWDDNLNEPVSGITITNNAGTLNYQRTAIVTPSFKDYMIYGPLPFNELLKTGGDLTQNQGW